MRESSASFIIQRFVYIIREDFFTDVARDVEDNFAPSSVSTSRGEEQRASAQINRHYYHLMSDVGFARARAAGTFDGHSRQTAV